MADAPVCHLPGDEDFGQPKGRFLPNIPVATDLPTALRAIRALTQMVQLLSGQLQLANQSRVPGFTSGTPYRGGKDGGQGGSGNDGGSGPGGGFKTQQSKPAQWQEHRRVVKTVKIPIGDSDEDFVEVKRTEMLDMIEAGTKNHWVYTRER